MRDVHEPLEKRCRTPRFHGPQFKTVKNIFWRCLTSRTPNTSRKNFAFAFKSQSSEVATPETRNRFYLLEKKLSKTSFTLIDCLSASHSGTLRGLLEMDLVILNHSQVTRSQSSRHSPNFHTTTTGLFKPRSIYHAPAPLQGVVSVTWGLEPIL
ncbi:hypothetical protein TNCV_1833691 [Trichonephila clavipes]|nr:hypothetical protein TNCV_1833691 [Trichonephila clavipes]